MLKSKITCQQPMVEGLEALAALEYPGRFIALGADKTGEWIIAVYGMTGRKQSSQARRLVLKDSGPYPKILSRPTNKKVLREGNPNLLFYPAVMLGAFHLAVSNGRQTPNVFFSDNSQKSIEVLCEGHEDWMFELDPPVYTPRISGRFGKDKGAALGIIKKDEFASALKEYFEVPLVCSTGKLIATYSGINSDPPPSFPGSPLAIQFKEKSSEETVNRFYEALSPKSPDKDFRVAIASIYYRPERNNQSSIANISIINKADNAKVENHSLLIPYS